MEGGMGYIRIPPFYILCNMAETDNNVALFLTDIGDFDQDVLYRVFDSNIDNYAQYKLKQLPGKGAVLKKNRQAAYNVDEFKKAATEVKEAIKEGTLHRTASGYNMNSVNPYVSDALDLLDRSIRELKPHESEADKPLTKIDNNIIFNKFNNIGFGGKWTGSELDLQSFLDMDLKVDEKGTRNISNRAAFLNLVLSSVIEDVNSNNYDYSDSPFKDRDDLVQRARQAMLQLNTGQVTPELMHSLSSLGFGSAAALLLGDGDATTAEKQAEAAQKSPLTQQIETYKKTLDDLVANGIITADQAQQMLQKYMDNLSNGIFLEMNGYSKEDAARNDWMNSHWTGTGSTTILSLGAVDYTPYLSKYLFPVNGTSEADSHDSWFANSDHSTYASLLFQKIVSGLSIDNNATYDGIPNNVILTALILTMIQMGSQDLISGDAPNTYYLTTTIDTLSGTAVAYNASSNSFYLLHVDPAETPQLYAKLYNDVNTRLGLLNNGLKWAAPTSNPLGTMSQADLMAMLQALTQSQAATTGGQTTQTAQAAATSGQAALVPSQKNGGTITGRMILKALTGAEIQLMAQTQSDIMKNERYAAYAEEAKAKGMKFEDVLKGKQASATDKSANSTLRNVATGLDVVGAGLSFIPEVGNILGTVVSAGGTILNLVADATDDSVSSKEMWTNLGLNAGLTALCLIPGGGSAKGAKGATKAVGMGAKILKGTKTTVVVGMPLYAGIKTVSNLDRIKELRAKADAGTLSHEERRELDGYYSMAAGSILGSKAAAAHYAPHFGNTTTGKALAWWAEPVTGTAAMWNRKAHIAFKDIYSPTAPKITTADSIAKYGDKFTIKTKNGETIELDEATNKALQAAWDKAAKSNKSADEMQKALRSAYSDALKLGATERDVARGKWTGFKEGEDKNVKTIVFEDGDRTSIKGQFQNEKGKFRAVFEDEEGNETVFEVPEKAAKKLRAEFKKGYDEAKVPEVNEKTGKPYTEQEAEVYKVNEGLERARSAYAKNEIEDFTTTFKLAVENGEVPEFDLNGYEKNGTLTGGGITRKVHQPKYPGEKETILENEEAVEALETNPDSRFGNSPAGRARLRLAAAFHEHAMDYLNSIGWKGFHPGKAITALDKIVPLTTTAEYAHGITAFRGGIGETADRLKKSGTDNLRAVTLMRKMFPEDFVGKTDKEVLSTLQSLSKHEGILANAKELAKWKDSEAAKTIKDASPIKVALSLAKEKEVLQSSEAIASQLNKGNLERQYDDRTLAQVLKAMSGESEEAAAKSTSSVSATTEETLKLTMQEKTAEEMHETTAAKAEEATETGEASARQKEETAAENAKVLRTKAERNGYSAVEPLGKSKTDKVVRLNRTNSGLTEESQLVLDNLREKGYTISSKKLGAKKYSGEKGSKRIDDLLSDLGLSESLIARSRSNYGKPGNPGIHKIWTAINKDTGHKMVFIAKKGAELKALRNFTTGSSNSSEGLPLFSKGGILMFKNPSGTVTTKKTSKKTTTTKTATDPNINPLTGDYNTGIGLAHGEDTWYDDIFSTYENDILDLISKYGDTYVTWLNKMQDLHRDMYYDAEKANGHNNWRKKSFVYGKDNKSIYDYQTAYDTYDEANHIYGGYNAGRNGSGDLGAISKATANNRYIFGDRGHTTDNASGKYKADGRYSLETDDRRILGRKTTAEDGSIIDDWTEDRKKEFNDKLAALGYKMEEDPTSKGNYYKIKPLNKSDETPVLPNTPTGELPGSLSPGIKIEDVDVQPRIDKEKLKKIGTKMFDKMNDTWPDLANYHISNRALLDSLKYIPDVNQYPLINRHRYIYDGSELEWQAELQAAQLNSIANNYQTSSAEDAINARLEAAYKGDALKAEALEKSLAIAEKTGEAALQLLQAVADKNYTIVNSNADKEYARRAAIKSKEEEVMKGLATNRMNLITKFATDRNNEKNRRMMANASALARNMKNEISVALATNPQLQLLAQLRDALTQLYSAAINSDDTKKATQLYNLAMAKLKEYSMYQNAIILNIQNKYDHVYFSDILGYSYPEWTDYPEYSTTNQFVMNLNGIDADLLSGNSALDNWQDLYVGYDNLKRGGSLIKKARRGSRVETVEEAFNRDKADELKEIRKQVENNIKSYEKAADNLSKFTRMALKKALNL